jgi:hypothetical protein
MDDLQIRYAIFRQRHFLRKEILRLKRLKPRVAVEKTSIRRGRMVMSLNITLIVFGRFCLGLN